MTYETLNELLVVAACVEPHVKIRLKSHRVRKQTLRYAS